jgi:hypothetical protein
MTGLIRLIAGFRGLTVITKGGDMGSAFRLTEFNDVSNVAILTLRDKGYRVWWEASERPAADDWWAEKEGREFIATNPLALLGLVALWESRGEEWRQKPGEPNLLSRLKKGALVGFTPAD